MSTFIAVIGTESYYDNMSNPVEHMRKVTFDYLDEWWERDIADLTDLEVYFTRKTEQIPESVLGTDTMSDRKDDATNWMENNLDGYDSIGSVQILDWVEKSGDGWPLGVGAIGTALTDATDRAGLTNMYQFQDPDFYYNEVEEFGTVFHELLHTFDAEHEQGSVNFDDESSFIMVEH